MKVHVKSICRSLISVIVISLFLIYSPALAVVTWNGVGGNGNTLTSTATNWVGGVAPVAGVADTLVFGSDGAILNQVNVDIAFTALTGINFTLADAAYTITDSGAGDLGFGAAATITNTVAFTHVINSSMTSAGLTFNLANNLTVGGVISGTTITNSGAATLSLGGTNLYTGATSIDAGILAVTANNALGTNAAGTTVATGATLDIQNTVYSTTEALTVNGGTISTSTGTSSFAGAVTLGADSTIGVAGTQLTLSGIIGDGAGTFGLTKTGDGIAVLSGVNSYDGITTINAGKLSIGADSGLGTAPGAATATQITFGGGTLESSGTFTLNATRGITLTGAGTIDVDTGKTLTYGGIIAGASTLAKADTGTLILGGNSTYTGATSINAGTLAVTANNALGTNAAGTTVANVATLDIQNIAYSTTEGLTVNGGTISTSTGTSSFAGAVTLGAGSTIGVAGTQLTLSGIIGDGAGTFGLTKTGDGIAVLSGVNSYDGITTINAGKLSIGADSGLGTAPGAATATQITFGGGTLESSGTFTLNSTRGITLTGAGTIDVDAGTTLTSNGIIAGASTLAKADTGTLILGGNSTYAGATTISAGTLAVTANNALGTNAAGTTVANGATLDIQNTAYSTTEALTVNGGTISTSTGTSSFAGAVTLGAGSTIGVAGTQLTLSGIIGDGGGALGLTKTGAGIAVLSGSNTYTGTTTINAGTLKVSGGAAIANAGAVSLANVAGAIFDLTTSETIGSLAGGGTTGGNVNLNARTLTVGDATSTTYAGVISGAGGALTKAGAGTLTLSGVNTYTGLTDITAGTLKGAFTVAGNLTVSNGGTFAPGSSIGTDIILGNYSLAAGGTLEVEVSKAAGGALSSDFLDVTGTATLAAGSTINVLDITPAGRVIGTGDTFNIIEADAGVTNNGPTITDNSAVLSFAGGVSGHFYQLVATREAFASALGGGGGPLAAIDSDLGNATGDYITVINALTALNTAELGSAEEQLDPLPHASATTVSLRTTQQMAGNLANYLSARRSGTERAMMFDTQTREHQLLIADASSDPRTLAYVINENKRIEKMQQKETDSQIKGFFRPFGVFYNHDSTSKMTGFNAKAVGTQFGFDKSFGSNLILGIGGGYNHSFINFKESRGKSDVDSFRVGPYASYFKDNFFVDSSVSFGYHKNKNERDIRFGTIDRTADSDYDAYDLSAYIGTGYDFHLKDLTATPSVSFQYISYRNESFKETGAGAAGLDVDAATSESLRSKLGMTLSTVTELHGTKIVPELFAGWAHEFMNDEDIRARFVQGAAKFTTDVDDEWDDSVYFGAGLSALLKKNISAFVRYEGEYSSGNGINALSVGITVLF